MQTKPNLLAVLAKFGRVSVFRPQYQRHEFVVLRKWLAAIAANTCAAFVRFSPLDALPIKAEFRRQKFTHASTIYAAPNKFPWVVRASHARQGPFVHPPFSMRCTVQVLHSGQKKEPVGAGAGFFSMHSRHGPRRRSSTRCCVCRRQFGHHALTLTVLRV